MTIAQGTLPWDAGELEERRFRRILFLLLAVFTVVAITVPYLPLPEIQSVEKKDPPAPLARILLEKQVLPEPKVEEPKPKPKPKLEKKPVPVVPIKKPPIERPPIKKPQQKEPPKEKPKQVDILAKARASAALSGVLAFKDDLSDMRDTVDVSTLDQTQLSRGQASAAKTERSLITSNVRSNSGGVRAAAVTTNTGGPALSGRETTRVESRLGSDSGKGKKPISDARQLGGRSDESIRRVMDKNKGAIFAIYNRALRKDPLLEGKMVFEMVIDASGSIAQVTLLSSELEDTALTNKILQRIQLIRFPVEEVISTRVNYSFDFLPFS